MIGDKRFIRKDILNTMVDDDLVLFDESAGQYYATSGVGASIWAYLKDPLTLGELCDRLQAEYEVDRPQCEREAAHFVDELCKVGVVMPT